MISILLKKSTGTRKERPTHDEVPLSGLCVSNLLVQSVIRQVYFGIQTSFLESLGDLLGILGEGLGDGDHDDLSGGQPEGPFATGRFSDDGDESLEGTKNGTMDHDWSSELGAVRALFGRVVFEVESLREVKVELYQASV